MAASNYTEFNLPRQAYAAFDATSLRQLIVDRLKASGLFNDIDFEGSNISALTDVIAYTYHVLLFYLNNTASESMFSQAELYENMNKIVSLIGYKPHGKQTALMNFTFTAEAGLPTNFYTLKRYTYATINGIYYSFNTDIAFEKTTNDEELIESIGENYVLNQGIFKEYPQYIALGEEFEQVTIAVDQKDINTSNFIDYNNVNVFVKDYDTSTWSEWSETGSLFFNNSTELKYEKRYNENGRIELKFGNGVNGKKLKAGDIVAIYYLESQGAQGTLGPNAINNANITLFNSQQFNEISNDIYDQTLNYITANDVSLINLDNLYSATLPVPAETVESIRKNAPLAFTSQNRLVTTTDYSAYVLKNFSNIVSTVSIANNKQYVEEYLKYFYNIGLEKPNDNNQVLMNQVSFHDTCDFNNVYVFGVPKISPVINETTPNSLSTALKHSIINKLNTQKMITQNIVVADPIYTAFSFGIVNTTENVTIDVKDTTYIVVTKKQNSVLSKEQIKTMVYQKIVDFFDSESVVLGQLLDFNQLVVDILSIAGVDSIATKRGDVSVQKLSFVYWNPNYTTADVHITSQNIQLPFYKFPFLFEKSKIVNNIIVV